MKGYGLLNHFFEEKGLKHTKETAFPMMMVYLSQPRLKLMANRPFIQQGDNHDIKLDSQKYT
jgi:hypothetical protein